MTNANWRKVTHFISSVFLYVILTIIGIIFIMFLAYFIDQQVGKSKGEARNPLFGAYVIISESMIPTININDAVVTMRATEKDIKVDDIITFISKEIETQGTPITHRVVGIVRDPDDDTKVLGYRTKGDHNNTQDFALIAPNEVLGKMLIRIPLIGYVQTFLTKPLGWFVVIVLPCFIIIFGDISKIIKSTKKKNSALEVEEDELRKIKRGK